MLVEQSSRAATFLAVDYPVKISFLHHLSQLADTICERLKGESSIGGTPFRYVFRDPKYNYGLTLDHQRFLAQTLGLDAWREHLDDTSALLKALKNEFNLEQFSRAAFQVVVWLDIKLSHAEITDLIFENILQDRKKLAEIFPSASDAYIKIDGEADELKYTCAFTPMTKAQAETQFAAMSALRNLVPDVALDKTLLAFKERISETCLYVEISIYRESATLPETEQLMKDGLPLATKLTDNVVNFLRALPTK